MTAVLKTNPAPTTDADLVRAAAGGCRESFAALARAYQVPLLRFLRQRLGATEDAEDVFQETMLAVHRNLDRYDDRWAFSTWVFTIARRQAVSFQRRPRLRLAGGDGSLDHVAARASDPAGTVARDDDAQNLWTVARRALSADQFDIVWMHYAEQLSLDDVAKVVDKSSLSVRVALHRARQKLKRELARMDEKEGRL